MTPFSDSPAPGDRGPQRRGPAGGPGRDFNRPPARGFGRGPSGGGFAGQGRPYQSRPPFRPGYGNAGPGAGPRGPGPDRGYGRPPERGFGRGPSEGGFRGPSDGGFRGPSDRGGRGDDREFRPRVSFRPDGSQRNFDRPRPPRPGRLERDAIRSGERPFYRPRPDQGSGPGQGGEGYQGDGGYGRGPQAERPGYGGRGPQDRPAYDDRGGSGRPFRREDDGFEGNDDLPYGGGAPRGARPNFSGPRPPARSYGPPRENRGPARSYGDGGRPPARAYRDEGAPSARPIRREPAPQTDYEPEAEAPEAERSNLDLAVMVVEKATPRIPADLLLRQTLSRRKRLTRGDSAFISRAVFSYYRWLNWLPEDAPLKQRIEGAIELATRFAADPTEVSDEELLGRTVPSWIGGHLNLSGAWVRSLQTEPPLWLRARKGAVNDLKTQLGNCEPSGFARFPETFRYVGEEDLFRHDLFQAGAFEIQDIASQAVGLACAPKPNETWWDTCAGEGGKTLHLSDLMEGKGLIWATDRSEWRLDRLKLRAGRAGCFNYRSRPWDGTEKLPTNTEFDGILVDAPCSGIGTWGRNPHSRWTVTPNDITELAAIQKQILHNAARALKVGGRLVYAVCTLSKAETWDVAQALTEQHPELEALPLENPFSPDKVPSTAVTLWPQETLGNGMFIAAWRRKA